MTIMMNISKVKHEVSSEMLENRPKFLDKSVRKDKVFNICMRMSSTPSPQVIIDPSISDIELRARITHIYDNDQVFTGTKQKVYRSACFSEKGF